MRTILVQITLTYTKGIRLVTYSAYYIVFDVKLGRTNAPLVDRSVVLVIFPLVSDSTRILLSVSFIHIFIENLQLFYGMFYCSFQCTT